MEEKVEDKKLLPESQTGFRRSLTIDNIFILDHIVQKKNKKKRKEGKVYTFFADLKTAFNNVNRKKL